jgi:hypothetical protein
MLNLRLFAVGAFAMLASMVLAHDQSRRERRLSDAALVRWVEKQVQARQPPAADKRFDEIGWARDIGHALQLARKYRRPMFLFTHDGRMNLGRC